MFLEIRKNIHYAFLTTLKILRLSLPLTFVAPINNALSVDLHYYFNIFVHPRVHKSYFSILGNSRHTLLLLYENIYYNLITALHYYQRIEPQKISNALNTSVRSERLLKNQ